MTKGFSFLNESIKFNSPDTILVLQSSVTSVWIQGKKLTLKAPRKNASENVVC